VAWFGAHKHAFSADSLFFLIEPFPSWTSFIFGNHFSPFEPFVLSISSNLLIWPTFLPVALLKVTAPNEARGTRKTLFDRIERNLVLLQCIQGEYPEPLVRFLAVL
jgi:hypothetical protein